jgi:hypothetical protein
MHSCVGGQIRVDGKTDWDGHVEMRLVGLSVFYYLTLSLMLSNVSATSIPHKRRVSQRLSEAIFGTSSPLIVRSRKQRITGRTGEGR